MVWTFGWSISGVFAYISLVSCYTGHVSALQLYAFVFAAFLVVLLVLLSQRECLFYLTLTNVSVSDFFATHDLSSGS